MSEHLSDLQAELSQKFHEFIDFLRKNAPAILLSILAAVAGGAIATHGSDVVGAFFTTSSQNTISNPSCTENAVALHTDTASASGPVLGWDGNHICVKQ